MSQYKVFYTETIFPDVHIEQRILESLGAQIQVGECLTEEDVIQSARDADAVAAFTFKPISRRVLDNLKQCRTIVRGGIGVDTIDVPAATEKGIPVVNVPMYCVEEVSDHAVTLMLCLLRKLPIAFAAARQGIWDAERLMPLHSFRNLTVGIIGFGNIGRLTAKKSAAFGMSVIFHDPQVQEDVTLEQTVARRVEMDTLLAESDVIQLHAPATPHTRHLINRQTLKNVKHGCILINTARGQLVNTAALVEALESGVMGGAGLDFIEDAPPFDKTHPLLKFENVIITPYTAWYTEDSKITLRETMAHEIKRALSGNWPLSVVNPEVKANVPDGRFKETIA